MKRIIIHWTAGSNNVSDVDREHYHFVVAGQDAANNVPPIDPIQPPTNPA